MHHQQTKPLQPRNHPALPLHFLWRQRKRSKRNRPQLGLTAALAQRWSSAAPQTRPDKPGLKQRGALYRIPPPRSAALNGTESTRVNDERTKNRRKKGFEQLAGMKHPCAPSGTPIVPARRAARVGMIGSRSCQRQNSSAAENKILSILLILSKNRPILDLIPAPPEGLSRFA